LSRIEDGQRTPSLRALRVLAEKLGVTLEHLETGREIPLALEREYQLASAELELRLGGSEPEAEQALRELAAAEPRTPSSGRARSSSRRPRSRTSSPPRACASTTTAPSPRPLGRRGRRSRRSPTPGARSPSSKRSTTPTSSRAATASPASCAGSSTSGSRR